MTRSLKPESLALIFIQRMQIVNAPIFFDFVPEPGIGDIISYT